MGSHCDTGTLTCDSALKSRKKFCFAKTYLRVLKHDEIFEKELKIFDLENLRPRFTIGTLVSAYRNESTLLEDYFKIGNDLDSYIKLLGLVLVEHFCWNLLSTTNNHQNFGKYYNLHTPVS